ncbi:MAG TPA: VCBS domain-containing protein, partial [Burkholderiales bacterium]|nr:VCBS domain-containing protein [Burkholderiales bacterium]
MLALEPRVLFDGVAITDIPDVSTKPTPSAEAAATHDPLVVLIGDASPAQRTQSESTGPHNLIVSGEERAAAPARAALEQSLQLAERHLADLVHDAGYDAVMREIYGGDVTDDALQRLREDVARGSLGVRVELVAPDVLYGNAACYAAAGPGGGERIYVNADWLAHASRDEAALVLLEETGHAMDRRLNAVDTPGDEGELFSYRATRTPLDAAQYDRIRGEDDSGVVQIDGRSVVVEFSVSTTNPGPYSYVDTAADDGTFASQTGTLKTGGNNDKIQGIWTGSGYASSIAVQNGAGTVTLGTLSLSAGTIGKGSTTNAGTWTFTPDSAAIQGLTTNELNRTVRIDAKSGQTTTSVTLTFNFYGADDVPAGASRTITTAEDTSYAFRAADFGFSDRDAGDALSAVRIDTLPSAASGTLQLSGVAVTAGEVIAAQDLGALTYAPAANANGAALGSFAFSVRDTAGNAYAAAPGVITLDVTAVNDAPTVSAPASY